jgi:hypothetical protein
MSLSFFRHSSAVLVALVAFAASAEAAERRVKCPTTVTGTYVISKNGKDVSDTRAFDEAYSITGYDAKTGRISCKAVVKAKLLYLYSWDADASGACVGRSFALKSSAGGWDYTLNGVSTQTRHNTLSVVKQGNGCYAYVNNPLPGASNSAFKTVNKDYCSWKGSEVVCTR